MSTKVASGELEGKDLRYCKRFKVIEKGEQMLSLQLIYPITLFYIENA